MDRNNILKLAIEVYGTDPQMLMAIEECSELTKAICKLSRGGTAEAVMDEVADVQIMIDQLKLIFDADRIADIENQKLVRLEQRINAHIERSKSNG